MELNGTLTIGKGAFSLIKKTEEKTTETEVQRGNQTIFAEAGLIRHEYVRKKDGTYGVTIKNYLH